MLAALSCELVFFVLAAGGATVFSASLAAVSAGFFMSLMLPTILNCCFLAAFSFSWRSFSSLMACCLSFFSCCSFSFWVWIFCLVNAFCFMSSPNSFFSRPYCSSVILALGVASCSAMPFFCRKSATVLIPTLSSFNALFSLTAISIIILVE